MKKKTLILFVALALAFGSTGFALPTQAESEVALMAGQNTQAGTVKVSDDGDNLYVTYQTNSDWAITETHLAVAADQADIPQTRKGNPKVGRFAYSNDHNPAVASYTYTIPLSELGMGDADNLNIAAHAVVAEAERVVVESAPYYAIAALDYDQGTKKDGSAVDEARSDPENALYYETGRDVSNFYSLGFGGHLAVEYEYPVTNGPGNDIRIIEDTWGSHPLEKADVYASQNGTNWVYLGEADNTNLENIHTTSEFDLGVLGWARYIKVVDTSNPAVHSADADGYDLNAIEVLHDYEEVVLTGGSETAWGAGDRFVQRGNWATYFTYTLGE